MGMAGPNAVDTSTGVVDMSQWTPAETFDEFALDCCRQPHIQLLTDPDQFSLTRRSAGVCAISLSEWVVGSEMSVRGEQCRSYRVLAVHSGHMESEHRRISVSAGPGTAVVYPPDGAGAARWAAGSKVTCFKIEHHAVEHALRNALGREVTSRIDFTPIMPMTAPATQGWINMLVLFKQQLIRSDGLLHQPLVGMPFVEALVSGFLLAAEHSQLGDLMRGARLVAPRVVRTAVEIIEEEAHLPLTVSSIAERCHISVRSLQESFRNYMNTSPTAYLREVRLRRAHHCLLESDPSTTSVASVAYAWGFTNPGRFATAHKARYDEPPAATLRRNPIRRRTKGSLSCTERNLRSAALHDSGCRSDHRLTFVDELGAYGCRIVCHCQ
jgi:AraC-like DNA-binding protein